MEAKKLEFRGGSGMALIPFAIFYSRYDSPFFREFSGYQHDGWRRRCCVACRHGFL